MLGAAAALLAALSVPANAANEARETPAASNWQTHRRFTNERSRITAPANSGGTLSWRQSAPNEVAGPSASAAPVERPREIRAPNNSTLIEGRRTSTSARFLDQGESRRRPQLLAPEPSSSVQLTLHQVDDGFDLFGGDGAEDDPIDGLLNELEQEQPSAPSPFDDPFDFSEEDDTPLEDLAPPAEPSEQTPFEQPTTPFEQAPSQPPAEPEPEESEPPTLQIPPSRPEPEYYSPPERFTPPAESEPAAPRYKILPDETCDDHEASCRRFETEPFGRKLAALDAVSILSPNLEEELGGAYPCSCRLPNEDHTVRDYAQTVWEWNASAACHKPLYFEQQRLERYGHTIPIAHFALTHAEFYATLPVLPYKMGMYPPWECRYALGYYRPGDCAPYLVPPVPLSWRGAAAQAGAVLGVNYILP